MRILWLASWSLHAAAALRFLQSTTLGPDPQTVNRLNGESFQQDPLVTLNSYQYAVFWTASPANASVRHASVARRALAAPAWETLTLPDYNQTDDDGHDVITLGASAGDGTLHLGFDQHDNALRYRVSRAGVATAPAATPWDAGLFGPVLDHLPGLAALDRSVYFVNITYPRFLAVPRAARRGGADLLLELRVGRSGLGDDWLYTYAPARGWSLVGRYLEGVNNNAYINGLDFDAHGVLHTTWTYRDYVNDTGQDVAVEAGPNGPENNHDMDYAASADLGASWTNTWGQRVANASAGAPIVPVAPGITVFSIPKYGGILNQEAQTVDAAGRVHVLNRENTTGAERWYHYWRDVGGAWTRAPLPPPDALPGSHNITGTPTPVGKRGKLVAPPPGAPGEDTLFAVLPSNAVDDSAWAVLASTGKGKFGDWRVVWEAGAGCDAEPLFDRARLAEGVLSLYMVDRGEVKVVDFAL